MDSLFSIEDRLLIANLTDELKRFNDRKDREEKEDEFVLSVQQAAQLLGRSRQTISKNIRKGKLHKVERGGVVGILRSEIEKIRTH